MDLRNPHPSGSTCAERRTMITSSLHLRARLGATAAAANWHGIYLVLWLIPLLFGQILITSFAVLPLLLVPPVGVLIYWLVWQEFHG